MHKNFTSVEAKFAVIKHNIRQTLTCFDQMFNCLFFTVVSFLELIS